MNKNIHPTAIIEDGAEIHETAEIGPFCHIGPDVVIRENVKLFSHVIMNSRTTIGARTKIYPCASIGFAPQHTRYEGELSEVIIGEDNLIREQVTIHPGTKMDKMKTIIGDRCMLMVGAHVGHDSILGNEVILTNNAMIGGHVIIDDNVVIGGLTGVHQRVRIGRCAFVGGMTGVSADVIPYGNVFGNRARLCGLNLVGLKRRGFSKDLIHSMRGAYRLMFADEGTLAERLEDVVEHFSDVEPVMEIVNFIRTNSDRMLCGPNISSS